MAAVTAGLSAIASCGSATQAPLSGPTPTASGAVAAPASSSVCSGFALSLASDRGGQPSPVAAAEWFAEHGGDAGLPRSGWHEVGGDESGSTVRSGAVTLHVVRGPDGTWQVDSGSQC
jgi:hypothetical protein